MVLIGGLGIRTPGPCLPDGKSTAMSKSQTTKPNQNSTVCQGFAVGCCCSSRAEAHGPLSFYLAPALPSTKIEPTGGCLVGNIVSATCPQSWVPRWVGAFATECFFATRPQDNAGVIIDCACAFSPVDDMRMRQRRKCNNILKTEVREEAHTRDQYRGTRRQTAPSRTRKLLA